jgi:hypothetical protein
MLRQDTSNHILVDIHTERRGDNQGDPRAAEARVTPLQLQDDLDNLIGRPLRAWLPPRSTPREQCPVLAPNQVLVELEQGGRLHSHRDLGNSTRPKKQRAKSQQGALHR